jgi:outer membrane protein OmpA-like peptidoglycan-associated protein
MRLTSRITSAGLTQTILLFLLVFLAGAIWTASPANAQPVRASDTFYLKFGAGLSDFAGDASGPDFGSNPNAPDVPGPINGLRDFFDTEKFSDGGPFPYALSGEVGYHFSPSASVGLGYQFGQYPFVHGRPLTVRDDFPGAGGDLGTIRHTVQLLGRYMVKAEAWTLSPYFDTGLNLSFGGRNTAVGPLAGIGLDVSVSGRTSLFLESRINITFSDKAIDGVEGGEQPDALSALPSLGLKYTFSEPAVPPRVIALDGPAEVQVGESAAFTARINETEATRPLTYQWNFGDGGSGSGLTASHTYEQSGTYDVVFTARNDAGTARDSLSVEVLSPARIISLNATPNPAEEGELVRFESEVEGASPLSFEWDFGDGDTGFETSPTHTYEEPGEYTVRLTASNEDGEDQSSLTMQIERALPAVCETVREFNSVYFDFGSSQLTSGAEQKLQENADVLLKCPNLSVRVEGFTSPREPNGQALSEARAQAATDVYEAQGVAPDRIETSGEGVIEGATGKKGDTSQSRRVDTILLNDDTGDSSQNN